VDAGTEVVYLLNKYICRMLGEMFFLRVMLTFS